MGIISTRLSSVDRFMDYVPVLGTASNLFNIFQKCVIDVLKIDVSRSHYYTYLKNKSYTKCFVLMFPVLGVIAVRLYEWEPVSPNDKKSNKPIVLMDPVGGQQHMTEHEKIRLQLAKNGLDLAKLTPEVKKDPILVETAVRQNGLALQYADQSLKKDPKIVEFAVESNPDALQFADPSIEAAIKLQLERKAFLAKVKSEGKLLFTGTPAQQADKEIVLAAVDQDPAIYPKINDNLKSDLDIAAAGLKKNIAIATDVKPDVLKSDKVFFAILEAYGYQKAVELSGKRVIKDPEQLKQLLCSYRNYDAFKNHVLCDASPELRKNRKLMLEIVEKSSSALEFADPEIKKDKEVVLKAIRRCSEALKYADISLRKDPDFVLEGLKSNVGEYGLLEHVDVSLQKDPVFWEKVIAINPQAIMVAPDEIKSNRTVALEAVKRYGRAFVVIDKKFRKDKEICDLAVKNDPRMYEFIDRSFKVSIN